LEDLSWKTSKLILPGTLSNLRKLTSLTGNQLPDPAWPFASSLRRLTLTPFTPLSKELAKFLMPFTSLTSLRLLSQNLVYSVNFLTNLTELHYVEPSPFWKMAPQETRRSLKSLLYPGDLRDISEIMTKLEKLTLCRRYQGADVIVPENMEYFDCNREPFLLSEECSKLTCLKMISQSLNATPTNLKKLTGALGCPEFDVSVYSNLTHLSLPKFLPGISTLTNLESLKIYGPVFPDNLSRLTKLRRLEVGSEIEDSIIARFPKLTKLIRLRSPHDVFPRDFEILEVVLNEEEEEESEETRWTRASDEFTSTDDGEYEMDKEDEEGNLWF
jgi:hypothetical protein